MKLTRTLAVAAVLTLLFTTAATGQNPAGPPGGGFPDLVAALKAVPGCIGVETARTGSGKQVIFAWFENKKAVLNWYYSPTHQAVMKQSFAGYQPRPTPLADIPDDDQPVLAIASLTMVDKPQTGVTSLPVSQIAIELYRPLPGGVALGGRFAPAALKVPGLTEVPATPPTR
jgi:antibiotic biosynthesis monooxygenase